METQVLKIAVISDLHCHPKRSQGERDDSHLLTDKLRTPSNDHPVENLISVLKDIEVDVTLCPGDFTDKANVQGFISGWGFALEIHRSLKSKEIIATLGNHDVDVYEMHSNYTLDIAKGVKRGFPISNESESDTFWSRGCVFLERDNHRILLINSSHFHFNKTLARAGKVGDDLVEYVNNYLSKRTDNKINIAMSHHHPIEHSRKKLGEHDKIENGEALLNILSKYKFDLFIHGHKHDPLIRYHNTSERHPITVFSSGSFSSFSNTMFSGARNTFHLITIKKGTSCKGEISTWTFFPNEGWSQPNDESGFPAYTGFGSEKRIGELVSEIKSYMTDKSKISWKDLISKIPDLCHLLPNECVEIEKMLETNNLKFDKSIRSHPTELYNLSKL